MLFLNRISNYLNPFKNWNDPEALKRDFQSPKILFFRGFLRFFSACISVVFLILFFTYIYKVSFSFNRNSLYTIFALSACVTVFPILFIITYTQYFFKYKATVFPHRKDYLILSSSLAELISLTGEGLKNFKLNIWKFFFLFSFLTISSYVFYYSWQIVFQQIISHSLHESKSFVNILKEVHYKFIQSYLIFFSIPIGGVSSLFTLYFIICKFVTPKQWCKEKEKFFKNKNSLLKKSNKNLNSLTSQRHFILRQGCLTSFMKIFFIWSVSVPSEEDFKNPTLASLRVFISFLFFSIIFYLILPIIVTYFQSPTILIDFEKNLPTSFKRFIFILSAFVSAFIHVPLFSLYKYRVGKLWEKETKKWIEELKK